MPWLIVLGLQRSLAVLFQLFGTSTSGQPELLDEEDDELEEDDPPEEELEIPVHIRYWLLHC